MYETFEELLNDERLQRDSIGGVVTVAHNEGQNLLIGTLDGWSYGTIVEPEEFFRHTNIDLVCWNYSTYGEGEIDVTDACPTVDQN